MGEAFDIGCIYVSRENYFGFGEISTKPATRRSASCERK